MAALLTLLCTLALHPSLPLEGASLPLEGPSLPLEGASQPLEGPSLPLARGQVVPLVPVQVLPLTLLAGAVVPLTGASQVQYILNSTFPLQFCCRGALCGTVHNGHVMYIWE